VRIIHRGVDLKFFHSTTHSPERMIKLAKEWHLPDEPVILFPGRLTRWKGQDVFIKALEQIPHRHFFAVILGDDKGHHNYRVLSSRNSSSAAASPAMCASSRIRSR
jgi:glycogen synthase